MKTLFTCVGTTDPVRGYHDGPMLHILRHYRPERVCVFMSGEIAGLNAADRRFPIAFDYVREHWDGYCPQVEYLTTDISDPSDLDTVSEPITKKVIELASGCDGDILLNLSSGTPQMKIVLAMLASDMRYRTIGVQVKNPDKASGSSERTNEDNYSAEDELECNEDESPDSENRCIEPELLHLQRQKIREQIIALLEQRNYSAIYAMKNSIPDSLKALVGHLDARDRLQDEEARKKAQSLKLPFPMYPKKETGKYSDYNEISEAYLVLLNREHRKQYEEMVFRLNPLVVRLEMRLLKTALAEMGLHLEDIYGYDPVDNGGGKKILVGKLQALLPDVYRKAASEYTKPLYSSAPSVKLCYSILKYLPSIPENIITTLTACNELTEPRNEIAHELKGITEAQIKLICAMYPYQLLSKVGDIIVYLYPECDTSLFTIYKRCGEYIVEKLA